MKFKLIALFLVVTSVISCNSPESDGVNAAKALRECDELFMKNILHEFEVFVDNFEEYNFTTRIEARKKVDELIEKETREYNNNLHKAEQQYIKYKQKYIKNREDAEAFEFAYQQQKELDEQYMQHGLPSQQLINDKILTIIPPKPDIDKIQLDLIGRRYKDKSDGYFPNSNFIIVNNEIKGIDILSSDDNNGLYKLNALITLQERVGSITYKVDVDIIYLLGDSDDWTISGFSANSITVVKTGEYNKYISAEKLHPLYGQLKLINYSDMTLIVGGILLSGDDKRWLKFSVDIEGGDYVTIGGGILSRPSDVQDYEIHFVERR